MSNREGFEVPLSGGAEVVATIHVGPSILGGDQNTMNARQPFAAVVATKDRLGLAGDPDTLAPLLAAQDHREPPRSILPGSPDWSDGVSWQWHCARPASWVVREIATGRPVFETCSLRVVERLNTAKYEAVTILSHLHGLNKHATPSTFGD